MAEIESKLHSLKNDRERLGAVNLRADEELSELETKHNGIASERDDLVEAIKRLRQAIGSLNREGRERLLAAFDVVNNHFQRLFTTLFGGGTAELKLVDSDDPLGSGLEIFARPPGKKPQSMTLLSGGEQALTATALIFAVFLTNPSPICVLDEVDAPLDDANVERYCDLLDDMARQTETRFVVITHNPITMARMDRLFGVTMAERGISQLVSVDLQSAEHILEVAYLVRNWSGFPRIDAPLRSAASDAILEVESAFRAVRLSTSPCSPQTCGLALRPCRSIIKDLSLFSRSLTGGTPAHMVRPAFGAGFQAFSRIA